MFPQHFHILTIHFSFRNKIIHGDIFSFAWYPCNTVIFQALDTIFNTNANKVSNQAKSSSLKQFIYHSEIITRITTDARRHSISMEEVKWGQRWMVLCILKTTIRVIRSHVLISARQMLRSLQTLQQSYHHDNGGGEDSMIVVCC